MLVRYARIRRCDLYRMNRISGFLLRGQIRNRQIMLVQQHRFRLLRLGSLADDFFVKQLFHDVLIPVILRRV